MPYDIPIPTPPTLRNQHNERLGTVTFVVERAVLNAVCDLSYAEQEQLASVLTASVAHYLAEHCAPVSP